MRCKLMTSRNDAPDECRKAFGYPSEREERRAGAACRKKLENPVGIRLNARRPGAPIGRRHDGSERLDLKIVFDIHGHGMCFRDVLGDNPTLVPSGDRRLSIDCHLAPLRLTVSFPARRSDTEGRPPPCDGAASPDG